MANPPFNLSDWGADKLEKDARWKFGLPPAGNANFAWMQHMIHHLSPIGRIGLVLANGALSSQTGGEGTIRQKIVEADLVEGIIALPSQLFYSTGIPVSLWFLSRSKQQKGKVLFIDARNMGTMPPRHGLVVAGGLLLRPYQETENGRRVSRERPASGRQRATTLSVRRLLPVKGHEGCGRCLADQLCLLQCSTTVRASRACRSSRFCIVLRRTAIGRHRWRQPTPECRCLRIHIYKCLEHLTGCKVTLFQSTAQGNHGSQTNPKTTSR